MASFTFKPEYLNKTTVKEVSIREGLGRHSRLYLNIAHSYNDDDLASLLGQKIVCSFKDGSKVEEVFTGVITWVEYQSNIPGERKVFKLTALSDTIRADQVKRCRVFQKPKAKLRDVANQIFNDLPCDGIMGKGNFDKVVPLSIQYNETDFKYLSRLMSNYGIPLFVDRKGTRLRLGQLDGASVKIEKKDIKSDVFLGSTVAMQEKRSFGAGGGTLGTFKKGVKAYNDDLRRPEKAYFANTAFEDSQERMKESLEFRDHHYYSMVAGQRKITTHTVFLQVGQQVSIEGTNYMVINSDTVYFRPLDSISDESIKTTQHHLLVEAKELISLPQIYPPWRGIDFLARVTKNEGDKENFGRVQVRFNWEVDQSASDSNQCWVDVLTPYAGMGPSSDNGETFGINMLPEVGEDVLVRFIDDCDDKPVIIGSIRRQKVHENVDTAKYKTIRTPKGSRIDIISDGKKEEIRIRAGESDEHHVDIITEGGKTDIALECNNKIKLKGKKIILESEEMEFKGSNSIKLDSKGSLALESTSEAKIESKSSLKLKGTAGADLESTAIVKVKGSLIQLN